MNSGSLLETLKIENGIIFHLNFHNKRMNASRRALFNATKPIDLKDCLFVPSAYQEGLVKCTLTYKETVQKINFEQYKKRNIQRLKLIHCNSITYDHKYADRTIFEKLSFGLDEFTEILIVKNGYLSDTSYSNLVLSNRKEWHTPKRPLLRGTQREVLLGEGKIQEKNIKTSDFKKYDRIHLINALLELQGNGITLPMSSIIF